MPNPENELIQKIDSEVRAGLANERDRLLSAWDNRRFADGCFDEYPTRLEHGPHQRLDYRRTSTIMGRVIDVLTSNLYKMSPTRQIADSPYATDWLERVYRRNQMLSKWQEADRLTHVSDLAAFQFAGDVDPESPVKVHLWSADQLVWWLDPEDQCEVAAVGTIDAVDARRRLTIWTRESKLVYLTDKLLPNQTSGGTAYRLDSQVPNPYRTADKADGILPFSFIHYKFPTCDFHTPGPGSALRRLNDYVNYDLDDMGDGKRYLSKPIGLATGVDPSWKPPADVRPGMFLKVAGVRLDATGNTSAPDLRYLEANPAWLEANWMDLQNYIDHSLEMHGVPPGTIRLNASATSGIQILAEQTPLLVLAEKRRTPFAAYEAETAKVALLVGAAHLRNNKQSDGRLEAAALDPALSLQWPDLYVMPFGPDRDASDDWLLTKGLISKVAILMKRDGLTRDQAIERLKQVVLDNAELTALGIDPLPVPEPSPIVGFGPSKKPPVA